MLTRRARRLPVTLHATVPAARPVATPQPSPQLAQAMRQGWNLEMDWLWLATQVSDHDERRYGLDYALSIHPGSELAQAALARLKRDHQGSFWHRLGAWRERPVLD